MRENRPMLAWEKKESREEVRERFKGGRKL